MLGLSQFTRKYAREYKLRIIQKHKFQTKHGNLDATSAYPQLDTSARPGSYTRLIQLQISLDSKSCVPGKCGIHAWIAGIVLLCKVLFCFV